MPSSTIGRGNVLYDYVIQPVLTPVAVSGSTAAEQNFTIVGLLVGDILDLNCNLAQTAGITIGNVRTSAANIMTVEFANSTAGSLTPVAGAYNLNIVRPENLPLPTNAL